MSMRMARMSWAVACLWLTSLGTVNASIIEATLTGDIRLANPDDLLVDVFIDFDPLNDATAVVTVDINSSPAHPNIKLDTFVMNINLDKLVDGVGTVVPGTTPADVLPAINIAPAGWTVETPGNPAGGGFGNVDFEFGAVDAQGGGQADEVNNTVNLSFTLDLAPISNNLFWTKDAFLMASSLTGGAGTGQLGAHLQSLVAGPGQSDSGFALGTYFMPPTPGPGGVGGPGVIPEAGAVTVWSVLALFGLLGWGRYGRKRSAA